MWIAARLKRELFGVSEVDRHFGVGVLIFAIAMVLGGPILSLVSHFSRDPAVGLSGLALFYCGSPTVAGLFILRKWKRLELPQRLVAVLLLTGGVVQVLLFWRLAASTGII